MVSQLGDQTPLSGGAVIPETSGPSAVERETVCALRPVPLRPYAAEAETLTA